MFSVNNIELHYNMAHTKLTAAKMNIDGAVGTSIIYFPFYVWVMVTGTGLDGVSQLNYSVSDYIRSNIIYVCITFATICFTLAMKYGKAGPAQAIDNLKIVWQVIMTIVIQGKAPNTMEIVGCVIGLTGIGIIILLKKEKA